MISKKPKEPSLILWLILGVIGLLSGILLFWLHTRQLLGSLQIYDIHWLLVTPLLIWLILLCLRGWLYNIAFHRYLSEYNETKCRQKRESE